MRMKTRSLPRRPASRRIALRRLDKQLPFSQILVAPGFLISRGRHNETGRSNISGRTRCRQSTGNDGLGNQNRYCCITEVVAGTQYVGDTAVAARAHGNAVRGRRF